MSLIIKTKKGTKKKAILGAPSKTQLSQKHQNLIKDLIEEQTKLILKEECYESCYFQSNGVA